MDDYPSTTRMRPSEPLGPYITRNSYYSHHSVAPSTQSWVYNHHQNPPGPPPPQPINLPSPVSTLKPLQNPHPHPLHVVNRTPMSEGEEDYMHAGSVARRPKRFGKTNSDSAPTDFGSVVPRPRKKKSFVGGFVKGIRRLPKTVLGYGSSGKNKLERSGTLDMEDTSIVTTGMTTGNTLPLYSSNPVTPIVEPRPSRSNPYHRPTAVSPIPESPPPEVVRLSDVPRHDSNHNVLPGSFELEPRGSQLFAPQGHRFIENLQSEGSFSNPVERTTVMLYSDTEAQPYNRNSRGPLPTPPVPVQQVSSPGLSYVSEPLAPLAPLRPASFHSSHVLAQPQPQTPAQIPRIASGSTLSQKVSQIPPPQRVPPPSLVPGSLHSSSHAPSQQPQSETHPQSEPLQPETQQASQTPPRNAEPPPIEPIQSPVEAHPSLAPDYREMGSSPSSQNHVLTPRHGRSHYDPSFSSELSPVERFFKTLYRMPWVSHERVTVDYKPGVGLGHMKKKKTKPLSSWYRSMLSGSRRSSATLDLLSSSNRTGTDRTSLSIAVAAALAAPLTVSKHGGRSSENKRKTHHHHHHHHHHSPRHHRHHEKSSHQRRRHTATSVETTDTDADEKYASPLLSPIPFPMQYPHYPYPAFPPFPVAAAAIPAQVQSPPKQPSDNSASSPGIQQPQQLVAYTPAGYASYQSMVAPTPVYVLQTASPTQTNSSIAQPPFNPATAAGGQQGVQQGQQRSQPAPAPSGMVYMPAIPGAFS